MTPYCHIHKKAIGPNRNYYRIYFDFIPSSGERRFEVTLSLIHISEPTRP